MASAACSRAPCPTLGFTISWIALHNLQLSLIISGGLAAVLLVIRLVQRSTVQFVINSMIGIAIAAVFALRSGRAEDAFLPGLIYNSAYAVVLIGSILLRWPLLGFLIGSVTGDPTAWHKDKQLVALCSKLTWILAIPCVLRVLVQYPLWATHHAGWLGIAKLAMGWPLQLAALATMAWVLSRDQTEIKVKKAWLAPQSSGASLCAFGLSRCSRSASAATLATNSNSS